jgi:hypothetical protein
MIAAVLLFALAADDAWEKLKAVKSGSEVRVFRKGHAKPIEANLGDVTDESLILALKKEQKAIPKEEIDRVDARPGGKAGVTRESKTTNDVTNPQPPAPPNPYNRPGPSGSVSSGVTIGKPGYETVYTRPRPKP